MYLLCTGKLKHLDYMRLLVLLRSVDLFKKYVYIKMVALQVTREKRLSKHQSKHWTFYDKNKSSVVKEDRKTNFDAFKGFTNQVTIIINSSRYFVLVAKIIFLFTFTLFSVLYSWSYFLISLNRNIKWYEKMYCVILNVI